MTSPGPVVITATFVGYLVAGLLESLVSTIGNFLPSFILSFRRRCDRFIVTQPKNSISYFELGNSYPSAPCDGRYGAAIAPRAASLLEIVAAAAGRK